MADPLSFPSVNSDDSDSANTVSSEGEHDPVKASKHGRIADEKGMKSEQRRLPPLMDVLAGAKRPEFTIDCSHEDVDWDRLTKKASLARSKIDVPNYGPVRQGKEDAARRNGGGEGFLYTDLDARKVAYGDARRQIKQLSWQRKEHWASRTETKYLSRRKQESWNNISMATTNKHLLGCHLS